MRTRDLHWPKARDIGLGSIWLIVALALDHIEDQSGVAASAALSAEQINEPFQEFYQSLRSVAYRTNLRTGCSINLRSRNVHYAGPIPCRIIRRLHNYNHFNHRALIEGRRTSAILRSTDFFWTNARRCYTGVANAIGSIVAYSRR
jgi:hypothetical protein